MNTLTVLNQDGDFEIKWDPSNDAEVEKTRTAIADLRASGYSFFLIDGRPADAVTAGAGALEVRRVDGEELVQPETSDSSPKRGRRSAKTEAIAVRPQRGG